MSGGGVASFDYGGVWSARFPELAAVVNEDLATSYFAEAGFFLDNTAASPVSDLGKRGLLLNLLVAHMAWLGSPLNTAGAAGLAGRITSASEGSVSVAVAAPAAGTPEWFAMSRYGQQFWAMTAYLRTMKYAPGPGAAYRRAVTSYPWQFGRRGGSSL